MTIPFRRESHRKQKVEELIKQTISRIIIQELKDPRCGFCTITRAKLSKDLKTANIFVSVYGDESLQKKTISGLEHAKSFIQKRLFQEVQLKHTPSIVFHHDRSIERSVRISQILKEEGVPETYSDIPGFDETEDDADYEDGKMDEESGEEEF